VFSVHSELTALASRDAIAKTPPSPEKIFCPEVFLGESCDSGHGSGLDGRAVLGVITNVLLGILWKGSQIRDQG